MLWWAWIGVTAWFLNSCGHRGMPTLEILPYSWRPVAFTKHLSSLHPSFICPCPGWKMQTQILYKAVLARSCPIYLISLTHLPNPGLSLVQSRVRLSPDGCNLFGWNELTCSAPEVEPSQATRKSPEQVFWGTGCWDENGRLSRPGCPRQRSHLKEDCGQLQFRTSAPISLPQCPSNREEAIQKLDIKLMVLVPEYPSEMSDIVRPTNILCAPKRERKKW